MMEQYQSYQCRYIGVKLSASFMARFAAPYNYLLTDMRCGALQEASGRPPHCHSSLPFPLPPSPSPLCLYSKYLHVMHSHAATPEL